MLAQGWNRRSNYKLDRNVITLANHMRNAVFPVCLEDPVRDKQVPGGVSVSSCSLAGGCVSRLLRYPYSVYAALRSITQGQAIFRRELNVPS